MSAERPRTTRPGPRSVRLATAEESARRIPLTYAVWGDRLTEAQYLERERRLAATPFARRGMRTWLLVHGDEVLASCESYAMAAEVDDRSGVAQGIASVFVEGPLRGQGFAAEMLRLLGDRFAAEGAVSSHLFSEVGTSLYERAGYRPRPIRARRFRPTPGDPAAVAEAVDRAHAGERLLPILTRAPRGRFRILPDDATLDWQRERAAIYHRFLGGLRPSPDLFAGAIAGDGAVAWAADYRLGCLRTLWVRPGRRAEAEALVEALRRAAHVLGLSRAEHWISPAVDLPGGDEGSLDDEIPMLRPFVPDIAPEDWTDYGRGCWV